MGGGIGVIRVQNRVYRTPSKEIFSIPSSQIAIPGRGIARGHQDSSAQQGHYPGTRGRRGPGILFQPVRSPQEGRNSKTGFGPKAPKQVHQGQALSDGIPPVSDIGHGAGRVFGLNRCPGCLLAHPYFSSASEVPSFCDKWPAFPVCGSAVRVGHGTQGFHESDGGRYGHSSFSGRSSAAILGRTVSERIVFSGVRGECRHYAGYPIPPGMVSQWEEVMSYPGSEDSIPGDDFRHFPRVGNSPSRQGPGAPARGSESSAARPSHDSIWDEGARKDGSSNRSNPVCAVSSSPPAACSFGSMGQESFLPGSSVQVVLSGPAGTAMVDARLLSPSGETLSSRSVVGGHNRRESSWLGSSVSSSHSSGAVVSPGGPSADQLIGDSSSAVGVAAFSALTSGSPSPGPVRQRHGSGVCESPGRHAQQGSHARDRTRTSLGREAPLSNFSGPYTRRGKLGSRFPESAGGRGRRMVPAPRGFPADLPAVGNSGRGSDGFQRERQVRQVCRLISGPASDCSGCIGSSMEPVSAPLPFSPSASSPEGNQEDQEGEDSGNSAGPRLAPSSLVRGSSTAPRRRAMACTGTARLTVPGADLPPELRGPVFDGMAVESWVLTQAGFGREVVATMINARKPASARIYHGTWKVFFLWCREHGVAPLSFSVPNILAFLQSGLDAGLAPSSLRRQISALSVLFQRKIANVMQVKTFIQGVSHLVPPFRAPLDAWDLNLVLGVLQEAPFEPLQEVGLPYLTREVVFLVAITSIRRVSELAALSCRAPFLTFFKDKVVLRPPPPFLPKVVSSFHINEDIVLPSFCPAPVHRVEKALHTLDLVRALRRYVSRTAPFRQTDSLFVIPEGRRKGLAASRSTIARWIRLTIQEAYRIRGTPVPPGIRAHSTRAVGASWALRHQASAEQVCKAATWSSLHTFSKHYNVHTQASSDASLGRKILQAAVAHL
ncbi:uncharacterized protein [Dendrobates tinctorius]|uniref:uncharacterized protein n=1 Tax=Dendrobates tinctorius TaxID=92724 RepID=UPI003CCA514A